RRASCKPDATARRARGPRERVGPATALQNAESRGVRRAGCMLGRTAVPRSVGIALRVLVHLRRPAAERRAVRPLATLIARLIAISCLCVAVMLDAARGEDSQEALRIGVLVPHAGSAVLAADDAALGAGTKAYPIQSSAISPFSIRQRLPVPSEASAGPLVLIAGSPAPAYATDLPAGLALDSLPVVVALGRRPPPGLTVSSCTSVEGVHISLWSGSGPQRTRRWSAYVYLGYDTEPTCTDPELAS